MGSLLLAVIYLAFVSLGLPDSLLGSAWPVMQTTMGVPSSYAGYVSMAIAFMTIISSLISPKLIQRFATKWIVIFSIALTVVGLFGFYYSSQYWMLFLFALPYGLGAGSVDAALNHYVANHYSSRVMNFLHCFYGFGAVISPNIMALALKYARWNEGYRWTAFVQIGILAVCILSLPLWKTGGQTDEDAGEAAGIRDALKVPGVVLTLLAFFSYCAGEATCFLWTSSYFAGTKEGLSQELVASFGSLIFGGLMLGRLIAGFVSNRLGDRRLIRVGLAVEAARHPSGADPRPPILHGYDWLFDDRDRHGADLSLHSAYGAGQFREEIQRAGHRPANGVRLHRQHLYAHGLRLYPAIRRHWNYAGVSYGICRAEFCFPRICVSGNRKKRMIPRESKSFRSAKCALKPFASNRFNVPEAKEHEAGA